MQLSFFSGFLRKNLGKSQHGGTQQLRLTFHDGDMNSSSAGPGDAAQSRAMGYGGTTPAGNHPCSEVKEGECGSVSAQTNVIGASRTVWLY
jgi:hypothetical protein